MKNNTQELKILLQRALKATPNDFALSEVKTYISAALNKLILVEDKRSARQERFLKSEEKSKSNNVYYNVKDTLSAIEEEIKKQKDILDNLKNKKPSSDDVDLFG